MTLFKNECLLGRGCNERRYIFITYEKWFESFICSLQSKLTPMITTWYSKIKSKVNFWHFFNLMIDLEKLLCFSVTTDLSLKFLIWTTTFSIFYDLINVSVVFLRDSFNQPSLLRLVLVVSWNITYYFVFSLYFSSWTVIFCPITVSKTSSFVTLSVHLILRVSFYTIILYVYGIIFRCILYRYIHI